MRLFQAPLDTCLGSPFFASLSVHGLHFTVYAASSNRKSRALSVHLGHDILLKTREGCGCLLGVVGGFPRKLRESPGKIAEKFFQNREML